MRLNNLNDPVLNVLKWLIPVVPFRTITEQSYKTLTQVFLCKVGVRRLCFYKHFKFIRLEESIITKIKWASFK